METRRGDNSRNNNKTNNKMQTHALCQLKKEGAAVRQSCTRITPLDCKEVRGEGREWKQERSVEKTPNTSSGYALVPTQVYACVK